MGHLRRRRGRYAARMLNERYTPKLCDMCGRPFGSKRNLQERSGAWSGADMCAAFDAARVMPRAQMGVRRSGPIQAHALEALVAKLVILIRSLDRSAIPLLRPSHS